MTSNLTIVKGYHVLFCAIAIHGILRWLRRLWTLCHEHIEVCERGERGGGEVDEGEERKIVSATHRAIQQVRKREREGEERRESGRRDEGERKRNVLFCR